MSPRRLNLLRLTAVAGFALAGCEQQFSMTTYSPDIHPVRQLCEQTANREEVIEVLFPEPERQCRWGRDGNGSMAFNEVSARLEQTETLLPAGAVLCEMELSSDVASMRYDDELILLLNGFILMASWDYTDRFDRVDGFPFYNWEKLKGASNNRDRDRPEKPFCLGNTADGMECTMPDTEKVGAMSLRIPESVVKDLMLVLRNRSAQQPLKLTLVTTGDDDPSKDCSHRDLPLSIRVKYVVPGAGEAQ